MTTLSVEARALGFVLDRRSALPVYVQLKWHIIRLVGSGEWPAERPLPSVRQLATDLGVAVTTVQRTYRELQAQGVLVGRPGRGVFVADFSTAPGRSEPERGDLLHEILNGAIAQAQSFGFGEDEIVAAVRRLARGEQGQREPRQPRLVFVGRTPEFRDKYGAYLQEAVADLGVGVERFLVADLEPNADAVLDALEPLSCLVSLVGQFPDLRRLAGHRGTPLHGLVVDLTEETQHSLVHLPEGVRLGLVVEDHYLATGLAMLQQYRGLDEDVTYVGYRPGSDLGPVIHSCPIIIHSLGCKRVLEEQALPETQLIELRYRPNAASVARLRALLSKQLRLVSGGVAVGPA